MTDNMSLEDMMKAFLLHGMDITYFKFVSNTDKENFFLMYTDLFKSMVKKEEEFDFHFTKDYDLFLQFEKEYVTFTISEDYSTLSCDMKYFNIENKKTTLILSILFLTIKELKNMIEMLTDGLLDKAKERKGKFTKLPKSFSGKVKHISSKQETLLDNLESNRDKIKIREVK